MKSMFESSEYFTAYATIDCGYFMMNNLVKEMGAPDNGINALIDKATGFDKEKERRWIKQAVIILNDVIEAKKLIEADCSGDEKLLQTLSGKLIELK